MICKLVLEALGTLLNVPGEDISMYRVPPGSNYGPTVSYVSENPQACLIKLSAVNVQSLDNSAADILYTISEHPDWNGELADQQGEGLKALFDIVDQLCRDLLETEGRKPIVSENFLIAVDGSRLSHKAVEVAMSLRGHGNLSIYHIADDSKDFLPPHAKQEYLRDDFACKCSENLIPSTNYDVLIQHKEEGKSTKQMLLGMAHRKDAQYLVLGQFGRKGPSIFQLGTVTENSVRCSPLTTIIVKTTSITPGTVEAQPGEFSAATSSAAATNSSGGAVAKGGGNNAIAYHLPAPSTFVVAVDGSTCAEEAVHTALRLMKPQDALKIMHVSVDSPHYKACDVVKKYQAVVEAALVDAEVILESKQSGKTVAQQICSFVSASNAHYLVMGIDGMAAFVNKVSSST